LIEHKLEEEGLKNKTKIYGVDRHTTINIGKSFRVTFIGINHSILMLSLYLLKHLKEVSFSLGIIK
jgi:mRNA degradation ribonuclease J1/J2